MSQLDMFFDPPSTAEHIDPWWLDGCLRAIEQVAAEGGAFQAYDLITRTGLSEPERSSWWGCAFQAARKQGLIVRSGYAPSKRPTVRGSACAEWRAA